MSNAAIYVGCTLAVVALLVYLYHDYIKHKTTNQVSRLKQQNIPSLSDKHRKYEPLRQMGLVQGDEFEAFYLPVIEKINNYERLINLPANDSRYFELLLKALRQRRCVIFENRSPETNSENHPYWTLALFLAILCRYTVRLLNSVEFRDPSKNTIIPFLETADGLFGSEKKRRTPALHYEANCIYIHLIEKIVPADVIAMLVVRGIYPFLINAVSGCYQQRQLPFYTLIERVENHVLKINQDDQSAFQLNINHILTLIENNTITKNTDKALVYESTRHLYIDRHLFWEFFKTYSVFEERLISKRDFEQKLIDVYELPKTTLDYDTIQINVSSPGDDEIEATHYIELTNLLCLPYSVFPGYRPHKIIRTKRIKIQREIKVHEDDEKPDVDNPVPQANAEAEYEQIVPAKRQLKQRRIENQKYLFAES